VVNRRGYGIHLTFEQYSSLAAATSRVVSHRRGIERQGSVYQEALAAATRVPEGTASNGRGGRLGNRKVLVLALLSLIQGLVVVVNEVFDVVGALHFT